MVVVRQRLARHDGADKHVVGAVAAVGAMLHLAPGVADAAGLKFAIPLCSPADRLRTAIDRRINRWRTTIGAMPMHPLDASVFGFRLGRWTTGAKAETSALRE
jgi:hypothetical protein